MTYPDEDSLALQVDISNGKLAGQRHLCLLEVSINQSINRKEDFQQRLERMRKGEDGSTVGCVCLGRDLREQQQFRSRSEQGGQGNIAVLEKPQGGLHGGGGVVFQWSFAQ